MTRKNTPQRPATLIPFDPVATLNEFRELINRLDDLYISFCPRAEKRGYVVRYSTIPPSELRKKLRKCDHVEIQTPDQPVRLRWTRDGYRTIEVENAPTTPEAKRLRIVAWSELVDPANDCIVVESDDEVFAGTLLAWDVESFLRNVRDVDGWGECVAERRHNWILAYQHAERLAMRLNGGFPEYLDTDPVWMETMNTLYSEFWKIRERWKLTQPKLPRCLSTRGSNPAMPAMLLSQTNFLLTDLGSAFSLMRDPIFGYFTKDPRAIELGFLLLLPHDYMGTPSEAIAQSPSWDLPESCHFVGQEPPEDEKAAGFGHWTFARCDRCGFSFRSGLIRPDELHSVFKKCDIVERASTPRLEVVLDPAKPIARLDGEPFEVNETAAKFLLALLDAQGNWVSSTELKRNDELLCTLRADRVKELLPQPIQHLVESVRGKGSRLRRALVWHS